MEITFDPSQLIGKITELQKVQIPRAGAIALNKAIFEGSQELKRQSISRFNQPVPLTQNAFLYKKATEQTLEGRLFVRDDVPKGNSPSRYLAPQIFGGLHYRTRFQRALGYTPNPEDNSPILAPNRVMIPTGSPAVRRNQYGNMSPGQYTQILSSVRGESSAGNKVVRAGRGRNKTATRYFYVSQEMLDDQYRNLRSRTPGIFMYRNGTLSKVLTESPLPNYAAKFPFFDIARSTVTTEFAKTFTGMILR
jgi:hypothetical protein